MLVRLAWPVVFIVTGGFAVWFIYDCAKVSIPDRGFTRDYWRDYAHVVFGPYLLAASGVWIACGSGGSAELRVAARVAGVLAWLAGLLILGVAAGDAEPARHGGPPPAMPASAMIGGVLLTAQYFFGVGALVCGIADWFGFWTRRE
jgi:hypothetical protein